MNGMQIVLLIKNFGGRLTGSYARQEEHGNSDFDFYIPERRWEKFIQAAPKDFESCICGHVAWRTEDLGLVEASCLFKRQNVAIKEREILGQVWKLW